MSRFIKRNPADAGSPDNPVATVAATDPVSVEDLLRSEGYTCEVQGITTGSVQIQSTIDGSTWSDEGAALAADGRVTISDHNVAAVRANVETATDVAVILTVAGRQANGYG